MNFSLNNLFFLTTLCAILVKVCVIKGMTIEFAEG